MRSAMAVTSRTNFCAFFLALGAALLGVLLGAQPARAQDYPIRAVTLIVPFPAGGGVDAMGRIVAERLTAALGQQVIVDNRGGAAGVIGARAAARAAPDGYTLAMSTSGTTSINPSLYTDPGYDPGRDFAPIGLVAARRRRAPKTTSPPSCSAP